METLFILYCEDNERKGTVVVDGGPKSTSLQIVRKLRSIGCIDLMILSHFDHDHIAGLYRYICTCISDDPFPVKGNMVQLCASIESTVYRYQNILFRSS